MIIICIEGVLLNWDQFENYNLIINSSLYILKFNESIGCTTVSSMLLFGLMCLY